MDRCLRTPRDPLPSPGASKDASKAARASRSYEAQQPSNTQRHEERPSLKRHYKDVQTVLSKAHPHAAKRARRSKKEVDVKYATNSALSQYSYISHWARNKVWPDSFFEEDRMLHLLARKGSASSLGRKRSNSSIPGASDEQPREEKNAPYRNPNYPSFLSEEVTDYKSYSYGHDLGVSAASLQLLESLLNSKQTTPSDTLFDDGVFEKHLKKLNMRNESRVIQDLSPLLVPSAEALASHGARHLEGIVESVNEGWNYCFPITRPRPQPDSSFGFRTSAFSDQQLALLRPTLGDPSFSSIFKATHYMKFPFLTKEVKPNGSVIPIAENQNLHSMTIAVRAVVELFKIVGRELELHREVLAFSISHDNKIVSLFAHYPVVNGKDVSIWRHTVKEFFIDTGTKWLAYTFTRNVYDIFVPMHLRRICSAIDSIPSNLMWPGTHVQTSEQSESIGGQTMASQPQPLPNLNAGPSDSEGMTPRVPEQIETVVQAEPNRPKRKKTQKQRRAGDEGL